LAIIREYQIATYVNKGTFCASACAIAWLGGVKRFVSYDGAVGFHGVYYADTLQPSAAVATLPEPSQAPTKQRD
jgi:hypothetical protein